MSTERPVLEDHQTLAARLSKARQVTDDLFAILRPGALCERPIPERHRLIFYLGHVEAFDGNLLFGPLGLTSIYPDYDKLFAFGIDPIGGGLPNEPASDWPSEAEVRAYGRKVRAAIDDRLADPAASYPELEDGRKLNVALEHRFMHAETLAYLFHQLDPGLKHAPAAPDRTPPSAPVGPHAVRIPAGHATLGLSRNGAFGWDNEFDERIVEVPTFEIDALKVTNGQLLEFVRGGGYRDPRFWNDADWAWRKSTGLEHPLFWVRRGADLAYRGMFGEQPLPLDWPVYVSHAEASAYARWAGRAIPSEAQYHRAAYGTAGGAERAFPWGEEPPSPARGNFDCQRWEPSPGGAYPAGKSAFGAYDLLGNGWEWTRSLFEPFPGFEPFPFYPGYSANFFDGHHYVMKGASPRTAACMLRRSFRNWFQPHYSYMYAAFRTVSA
jgi:ergothioneine biosynthesis protein EgtB